MRRLMRYVLAEILGPTLVAFLAYTGFMLIRGLVQFSDLVLQSEDPVRDTGIVLALSVPHIVVLTIPTAVLLGILVGIGRLSADSEVVALRAAGVNLVRLYVPIGILAGGAFLVTLFLMVAVVPRTNGLLYNLKLKLSTFALAQRIQPGVFSPEIAGFRIFVESASADRRSLRGLMLSDRSRPAEGERLTLAERGALEADEKEGRLYLRLENAVSHHVQEDPSRYDRISYAVQRVLLVDTDPKLFRRAASAKNLREQTLSELLETANARRTPVESRMAWVEIHKKVSFPAACLVFGLLGLPLGVVNRRGGRAAGFAVSAAIVVAYYILFAEGEAAAIAGKISPLLAMWLPNLVFLALGVLVLPRARDDRGLLPGLPSIARRRGGSQRVSRRRVSPALPLHIDRYVGSRFLRIFVLIVLSVVILYFVIDYMEISDDIAKFRPPRAVVLGYFEAMLVPVLVDVVPFAFLAAALVATAGLVRSSETTALLASGVSLYRASASLFLLAGLAGAGLFGLGERVLPRSVVEAGRLRAQIVRHPYEGDSGLNVWARGEAGRFFRVETPGGGSRLLTGVSVLTIDPKAFRVVERTEARRAEVSPGKGLVMEDGWTRSFGPAGESLFLRREGKFLYPAPEVSRLQLGSRTDPRQMTFTDLRRFIQARRKAGAGTASLRTGLYQKTALPFSALILTLVGLPFAFRFGKRGAVAGVGTALLLGLGYLFVSALLARFGETGSLPPLLAAWGANAFFGLGAAHALLGVRT